MERGKITKEADVKWWFLDECYGKFGPYNSQWEAEAVLRILMEWRQKNENQEL